MEKMMPEVTRVYLNHHLDSTRWEVYKPKEGDIIVTTSYKSGTSWVQSILNNLLNGDKDPLPDIQLHSPYVDGRFLNGPKEKLAEQLKTMEGRRFFKSHLPLDGIPYYPEVQYIIIARDPRDVFMSLYNHCYSYTKFSYSDLNSPESPGDPFPPIPDDPREFWKDWINKGWFEWESEGYPMWSNLHHTQTFWNFKHLSNFLFLHYNDLLRDLEGGVRRIAEFTNIEIDDEKARKVVEATTFANVKKTIAETEEDPNAPYSMVFKNGRDSFFFKGTNGRWRDVLNHEDLKDLENAKNRVLTPDCAKWLEEGGDIWDYTTHIEPIQEPKTESYGRN